jgi:hypothetical protein
MKSMTTPSAPILEDWTASCVGLWKVKHMSYLTTVRTQQAQGLDIVPLWVSAMLGRSARYYLQEFVFLDGEIEEAEDSTLFQKITEFVVKI